MPQFQDFLTQHPELETESEDTQYFFYEEYLESFTVSSDEM